jgi:hypothetical protein
MDYSISSFLTNTITIFYTHQRAIWTTQSSDQILMRILTRKSDRFLFSDKQYPKTHIDHADRSWIDQRTPGGEENQTYPPREGSKWMRYKRYFMVTHRG